MLRTFQMPLVLFTYGFWYNGIAQDVGDIGMFISQFKQRLTDCMTQRWHADISESFLCDTYKNFKSLLNVETYLCIDILFSLRKVFARFFALATNLILSLVAIGE